MTDLEGKNALVLGASAETGTGFAIARALVKAGAQVTIAARRGELPAPLAERIGARWMQCDAACPEQIAELADFASGEQGLDIAVNAAAAPVHGTIAEIAHADVERGMRVNYYGMLYFLRESAGRMNDNGSVVLITSYAAVQPIEPHFAYACGKAATDCLVRYAAAEYGHRGIRVNSIQPGPIKSDLTRELFDLPGVEAAFSREIPLGRVGIPDDYANVVLWLSGPAFVTGLNIPVSGGNQLTRMPRIDELPLGEDSYRTEYS